MNLAEAVAVAEGVLRGMDAGRQPLALAGRDRWREREWCYVFPFNSAAYYERGDPRFAVATGPLVVPKDGRQPFVAPSGMPVDRTLDEYERRGTGPGPAQA